jgi:PAS domain S-box-containing protein
MYGRDVAPIEHRLPTLPDGTPGQTVRLTLAPIRDAEGKVLYAFAQVQDISELRAAEIDLRVTEESFRLLVSAVSEYAIFLLDVDGSVASWNLGAQRIKGYTPGEIVGRSFAIFYPEDEQASGRPARNLETALRQGVFTEEGWRVRKDGSRFWASVMISPVYDDSGNHIGFAKVTRDQSVQREHEQERLNSIAQQIHLLAVTAHELRTPTAVIEGSAAALGAAADLWSTQERDEILTNIRSSVHRLRRLASDLATASHLHGGTLQYWLEDESLAAILHGVVARRQAATDVYVELDIPEDVTVRADAERLGQALDNLLDNAIRHGAEPIKLSAEIARESVHIRVTDSGRGVPTRLVPRLFERFAIAGATGGTGLGLYLVREISRAHDGEVEYRPPGPKSQTEFEIRLPRVS